jgi:tellurite resistance protein
VLVFVGVLVLSVVRANRYPAALDEDLRHPVRHGFVGALPVAVLLLSTQAVVLGLRGVWLDGLWWLGALGQLWATVWVLKRWLVASPTPAPFWPLVTPVLLISVVGNVVVPLAGLSLGHTVWSMAQFGVGLLLWPVVLTLLLVRRATQGPLPERLMPTWFITIAPPSVIGLVLLQAQAPVAVVAACWGMAVFFVLWTGSVAQHAVTQPFSVTFWSASFPLAAFTALTLKLAVAVGSTGLQLAGTLLLALTSLVVFGLCLATVRGLRSGSLLAPEPVAQLMPSDG